MKHVIYSLFILFACCTSSSQEVHELSGKFDQKPADQEVILSERIGRNYFEVEKSTIAADGSFGFGISGKQLGYYKLSLGNDREIEIIIDPNEKPVSMEFPGNQPTYQGDINGSKENTGFWEYKRIEEKINVTLKPISDRLNTRMKDRALVKKLKSQKDSLIAIQRNQLKAVAAKHPGTYFAKSGIASVATNPNDINGYFNDIDFMDSTLIRSNVFPERIMDYIHLHTKYKEWGFRKLVNIVMKKAEPSPMMHEFLVTHFLELFDDKGPPIMFQHIAETYLFAEGCSEVDVSEMIKNKAEAYKMLQVGNVAPDMTIPDDKGVNVQLSKAVANNDYTLLFFWYAHCQYCHTEIPYIKKMYSQYKPKGFEIIGISIDSKKNEWLNGIKHEALPWMHLSELKGWKSPVVTKYKIHKTPGYYILDKNMKIMAKPKAWKAIENHLKKLMP